MKNIYKIFFKLYNHCLYSSALHLPVNTILYKNVIKNVDNQVV